MVNSLKRAHWLRYGFPLVVLLVISWPVGRWLGAREGNAAKARLELVWPGFMQLPDRDRAVLAALSLACRLATELETREAVVACLTRGVQTATPPVGVTNIEHEFQRLLKLAPEPASASLRWVPSAIS